MLKHMSDATWAEKVNELILKRYTFFDFHILLVSFETYNGKHTVPPRQSSKFSNQFSYILIELCNLRKSQRVSYRKTQTILFHTECLNYCDGPNNFLNIFINGSIETFMAIPKLL